MSNHIKAVLYRGLACLNMFFCLLSAKHLGIQTAQGQSPTGWQWLGLVMQVLGYLMCSHVADRLEDNND